MKRSTFEGVDPVARDRMLGRLRREYEQEALDALKRAVSAANHETYQFELNRAEEFIKAAMNYKGEDE